MWRKDKDAANVGKDDFKLWDEMLQDLKVGSHPRLREERAVFLVYTILDRVVKLVQPVMHAYAERLAVMHHADSHSFNTSWLTEVSEIQMELGDVMRSLRPLRPVIRHLAEDKYIFAKAYFEDVEDAIVDISGEIQQLQDMCKAIQEAHHRVEDS